MIRTAFRAAIIATIAQPVPIFWYKDAASSNPAVLHFDFDSPFLQRPLQRWNKPGVKTHPCRTPAVWTHGECFQDSLGLHDVGHDRRIATTKSYVPKHSRPQLPHRQMTWPNSFDKSMPNWQPKLARNILNVYAHPNFLWPRVFPESVWAKGSSKSGGLLCILTCSHLHILTCSHTHIFSSSHLLTYSHTHIFIHIFSSSHLHIFSSLHLHILTSSHLHIFTHFSLSLSRCSHLRIFTSSHLPIFTSSHLFTFAYSHLLTFAYSHLHIFSISVSLSLSLLFFFSLKPAGSADEARWYGHFFARTEVQVLKIEGFFASLVGPAATLSHETRFECQKLRVSCEFGWSGGNPCAWNEVRVSKTEGFWAFVGPAATVWRERRFERQKLRVFFRLWFVRQQPFHTKWCLSVKN